ncbi:MerR family transcriptional regulator [Clostridium aciditolerans]|uniref:MerR family transcriptional regulator n=1 Tax=Clostridium aciditolerans TaxID=339861 RepID=A0A934HPK3_9CLOT|nr:MerR family transcriptional regulator [Clostridium aciditolerans]MBI6871985.1 MerR family transcriptional regulator [Clostridium aciditolerans]
MDVKYYQIDEVAKITELTKRTIRYYEDMELYTTIRTDSGYRLYTEEDINTIKEIKDLRVKLGLTLIEVKKIIGLKKALNSIFQGEDNDIDDIKASISKVTELVNLVREREEILKRVEKKCEDHLVKLNSMLSNIQEK